jgi:hypothetical protein
MVETQKLMRRKTEKPKTEAEGSSAIGTIAILFIGVELFLVLFSDVLAIRAHLRYMAHNVRSRFKRRWS